MGPGFRARWSIARWVPRISPRGATLTVVLIVAVGVQSTALKIANGLVIGSLPAAIDRGFGSPAGQRLLIALGAMAGLFVLGQALPAALRQLTGWLGQRLDLVLRTRMFDAASRPSGVAHLEDPAFIDALTQARGMGAWFTPGVVVPGLAMIAATRLGAIGSIILLATFNPVIALLVLGGAVVVGAQRRQRYLVLGSVVYGQTQRMRRSDYLHQLAMSGAPKEIRIFGIGGWIRERFTGHYLEAMDTVWRERWKHEWSSLSAVPLLAGTQLLAFWLIARAGVSGAISLTEVAVLLSAVFGIEAIAGTTSLDTTHAEYGSQAYPKVLEVEERSAKAHVPSDGRDPDGAPHRSIKIEDLYFRYPGSERDVYGGLDLEIPAGHSLAIVGPNGAGKTTLAKLLARLYEPTAGRILIDDIDLREFHPRLWQRRVAAIFQDFATYYMPARENVGFGAISRLHDQDALNAAATRAGALSLIEGLPDGWETVLSRSFTDGTEISGGEWQRIALARALFAVDRGAGILILDEPTANLDVRAEAELFDRYLELTKGVTTILISHRFSTVRHAERICVIDEGRITEQGTHEELLSLDGRYARMFRLQASRFADTDATGGVPDA